jgi:hypothetical protein
VRAQDSAGNWMPAALTWTFQTAGASMSTIWDSSAVPATPANNDTASVELGVKFRSDVAGAITAIRFYKGTGNTGTHIGRLWSATGDLKGQVTFTSETATGWQQANFATPIPIEANTTYVASYLAPNGRYSSTSAGLASSVDRAPLHALASGGAGGNGVYAYGTGGFPTGSWNSTNYWVDVVFVDTGGPNVSARTPAAGATDVPINTTVTVTFDEPVASGLAMELRDSGGNVVVSNVTYDGATRTATLRPTSNLANAVTYTATVSGAKDAGGNAMSAPVMWSFTTVAAVVTPPPSTALSVFAVDAVPATASVNDPAAVELGMKFRSTVAGTVTGVRFYKGSANTGTHTGRLYSEAGAVLATVVFSGESATGWQTANFSAPVPITPNTTYVIAYHTTSGNYAVTGQFFNPGDVVNGPLIGRANYSNDRNGVYAYGAGGTLPTSSYNGGNYWVDVLFQPSS